MKNNKNGQFYQRVVMDILYSTVIASLVLVFLVTNINMLSEHFSRTDSGLRSFFQIFQLGTISTIIYVIIGIAVFSLSFLLLMRRSLKYISEISDAIRNISEGDLNTDVRVIGDDEFSQMAANLKKMEEDIRDLMEKERESERTKNELITNVAHDLRTPLTSIIGYLELLSGNSASLTDEVRQKYIDIAYSKSKRLQKLLEDLFGFTKLNYGKVTMNVSSLDIVKLLSQVLEEFYPNFMEKGLTYELKSNVPAQVITADGNLLARLFDNLINNAIKYGADGKKIVVTIHSDQEIVTIAVTNYGYVIPKEELPLIFNKFYRVEQSRSAYTGGTGLGLAIAKNIVDMHGGTIDVASDLNGTVFTVRLKVHFDVNKENFGTIG